MVYVLQVLIVLCVGESKAPPVLIHTVQHGLRGARALYDTARDNVDTEF